MARLVAAGDSEAAGAASRAVGAAYLLAVALGVLTAAILLVAAPWVAQALGARGGVLTGAVGYLRAAAAGLPFLYVSYAGNGHLIGLADTKTPLRIAVAANVANAGLEAALVFGAHAGLLGSAWGTVTRRPRGGLVRGRVLAAAARAAPPAAARRDPLPAA